MNILPCSVGKSASEFQVTRKNVPTRITFFISHKPRRKLFRPFFVNVQLDTVACAMYRDVVLISIRYRSRRKEMVETSGTSKRQTKRVGRRTQFGRRRDDRVRFADVFTAGTRRGRFADSALVDFPTEPTRRVRLEPGQC